MIRTALLVAALAAVLPAAAQGSWYAGIAAGEAKTDRELVRNRESTITLASDLSTAFDASDTAWKVFAGYRLNRNMAIEATYADLGSHHMFTTLQGGDPPFPASIAIDRDLTSFGVDLVAIVPIGERFGLFGRAGGHRMRLEAQATLDGNIVFTNGDPSERFRSTRRHESVLKFGLGAEWHVTPRITARLEWERYLAVGKPFAVGGSGTTGQADTDVWSLGALVRF